MLSQFDNIQQLTSGELAKAERLRCLSSFTHDLGWRPSDLLQESLTDDLATAHLLVEHGLQNTAVLSFLRRPRVFPDFDVDEQQRLLSLSYNNLVDWHVVIEAEAVNYVYVRTRVPTTVERHAISRRGIDRVRSEVFEEILDRRPNPNIPALDDALIRTISFWKRNLVAEMNGAVRNDELSALFNSIMFVRALEDYEARRATRRSRPMLLERLDSATTTSVGVALVECYQRLVGTAPPQDLIDSSMLAVFQKLPSSTSRALLAEFYTNKFAPYPYDFCVMSKHALSRIYEHYVSLLKTEESPQLSFIAPLPQEQSSKETGAIYTPHFIARFFARFLREQVPPTFFRQMSAADPACGSGMFLRTLLELQGEAAQDTRVPDFNKLFEGVLGIDVDANAVQAARLSLSLLYLALTGQPPSALKVVHGDGLEYLSAHSSARGTFDAVLANPPFVSLDTQSEGTRERLAAYLGNKAGRADLYLAFLRVAIELLKPGGFGLFVLPHSFLINKNAEAIREELLRESWIRVLADLSSISVFGDTGIYVVLLIFQKRLPDANTPAATIARIAEDAGRALQATLDGQRIESRAYSVYDIAQSDFPMNGGPWLLLPPSESQLARRFSNLPVLGDFLDVRQGVVTGADSVFIRPAAEVPKSEVGVYIPFLRDREMGPYRVPDDSSLRLFHPFVNGERIKEDVLRKQYPKTWAYLTSKRVDLEARKSLSRYKKSWWEPMWPRAENIRRRKLFSPHLVLMPRFSVDMNGQYAISHGPMLLSKEGGADDEVFLKFFCAVLNSSACYWHVARHSHTYRRGYVMLEPKTLRNTPVPDPAKVPSPILKGLVRLVGTRLSIVDNSEATKIEQEIDELVADLYGLSRSERTLIGLE